MNTYERVLELITDTPEGGAGHDRKIQWLTSAEVVGAARDHLGHVELFLAGPPLLPRTKALRSAIQHHSWHRPDGTTMEANRLIFPPFGHFDPIAALIATELLREGAEQDLPRAFAITEPIIELAIERLQLSESALLGLVGELLLLDSLCRKVGDHDVAELIASWHGWRRSFRDFIWEGTGVEVKATTRATSSHMVHGVHQIEPAQTSDDEPGEERLLLVSVGLQVSEPTANSFTVPQLTQRLVDRLEATGNQGAVAGFLANVNQYGNETGLGYNHAEMSGDPAFTTPYTPTFVRGYDMSDSEVKVIRRDDVVAHQHVDAQSVTFRVDLPAVITPGNPIAGLSAVAKSILAF